MRRTDTFGSQRTQWTERSTVDSELFAKLYRGKCPCVPARACMKNVPDLEWRLLPVMYAWNSKERVSPRYLKRHRHTKGGLAMRSERDDRAGPSMV